MMKKILFVLLITTTSFHCAAETKKPNQLQPSFALPACAGIFYGFAVGNAADTIATIIERTKTGCLDNALTQTLLLDPWPWKSSIIGAIAGFYVACMLYVYYTEEHKKRSCSP